MTSSRYQSATSCGMMVIACGAWAFVQFDMPGMYLWLALLIGFPLVRSLRDPRHQQARTSWRRARHGHADARQANLKGEAQP